MKDMFLEGKSLRGKRDILTLKKKKNSQNSEGNCFAGCRKLEVCMVVGKMFVRKSGNQDIGNIGGGSHASIRRQDAPNKPGSKTTH